MILRKLLKLVLASLAIVSLVICALGVSTAALRARAGGVASGQSGDVNGDGALDISDAVYTLVYLFSGGPAPAACADSPDLVRRVEALEAAGAGVAQAVADVASALREFRSLSCRGTQPLPDTGQNLCFDPTGGALLPCDDPTCPGQDAAYSTGCQPGDRFIDHGDGTVTDTCTGLMWQQDTADVDGNGTAGEGDALSWCQALAYCHGLSFAGHDD